MTLEEFDIIKDQLIKDITINERNVLSKSLELPLLQTKYLNLFSTEFKLLKDMEVDKEQLYGQLLHYYKFDYNFKLSTIKEIESHINGDKRWIDVCLKVNQQNYIVEYLEKSLRNLNQVSLNIKNYIDFRKFIDGN